MYGRKTQAESSSLELTVAKEKKVRALRKKLAGLDKQVNNISVIDPAGYELKMCVHCGFLQVSCFNLGSPILTVVSVICRDQCIYYIYYLYT